MIRDRPHASRQPCVETGGAVLDHDAVRGREAHRPGGVQEQGRLGLPGLDVVAAEDAAVEQLAQAGARERQVHLGVRAARSDAHLIWQRAHQFERAGHRHRAVFEGDVRAHAVLGDEVLAHRASGHLGHERLRVLEPTAAELAQAFLDRHVDARLVGKLAQDFVAQDLGVDQRSIRVEDHQHGQSPACSAMWARTNGPRSAAFFSPMPLMPSSVASSLGLTVASNAKVRSLNRM